MTKSYGEIVKGDLKFDGRVILYIIKGKDERHYRESKPAEFLIYSGPDFIHQLHQAAHPSRRSPAPSRGLRRRHERAMVLHDPPGALCARPERSRSRDR